MIKVIFKNVGQGDSIIVEWEGNDKKRIGIIDCNIKDDTNPILDEIIKRNVNFIDFIIISHLHFDHYSGFADVLEFCITHKVKIGVLFHTFETHYFSLFSSLNFTQKQWRTTDKFIHFLQEAVNSRLILDIGPANSRTQSILLDGKNTLSFLSPIGRDHVDFAVRSSKYSTKVSRTPPDFNRLSTVITIGNESEVGLLTSDATKNVFKRLNKRLEQKVKFVQVPHHGSIRNLHEPFWLNLKTIEKCPSVFSVGEVKKDKLPNIEVVGFFENNGYVNESTNFVYGIADFYAIKGHLTRSIKKTSQRLSAFSKQRTSRAIAAGVIKRFSGDRESFI